MRTQVGVLGAGPAGLPLTHLLLRGGLAHDGMALRFNDQSRRINLHGLTGRRVTIYGQQEAVKDMVAARLGLAEQYVGLPYES